MRKILLWTVALLTVPLNAQDIEQAFIDGFPDVPLLAGMQEIAEERLVFDTPAGTVAQSELKGEKSAKAALDRYQNALPTFGWHCERSTLKLVCLLDGNRLTFTRKTAPKKSGRIILRLEPIA